MMDIQFIGKTAIITGAGSGIGSATALALATAGANVVLLDNSSNGLNETEKLLPKASSFLSCVADVTSPESLARAFDKIKSRFGTVDLAVNNAGIIGSQARAGKIALDSLRQLFEVNLFGVFNCMQSELAIMMQQRRGAIVNLASSAGLVGTPWLAGYSASKHAVIGLTKSAALDYAQAGIRINAVCPGLVTTPMKDTLVAHPGSEAAAIAQHPIGRLARPDEIADAILWLLSDQSSFVTGATIAVDGGFTTQ